MAARILCAAIQPCNFFIARLGKQVALNECLRTTWARKCTTHLRLSSRAVPSQFLRNHSLSVKYSHSQQAYVSKKDQRIEKILNALGSLTPHETINEKITDDLSIANKDPEDLKKAYSSFSRLKPLIQQSLAEQPNLLRSEDETDNTISIIKTLHGNLGLGIRVIIRFLKRNPEVFEINEVVLKERIENFRSLKLREGMLQRVLSHTPHYLSLPRKRINKMASCLTGDMDFTIKELPELLLFAPQVFLNPLEETEEKFQYIYFTMGYKEHFMLAKYGVMRYSLGHIRTRHLFLERRGQFQLADKNQEVTIKNPAIQKMICSTDANFCREVALCKVDELKFFRKVLRVEDKLREIDSEPEPAKLPDEFADTLMKEMS